ncbi:MAG: ATP-binding cassette domain-containing protein [Clostridia bacterium]|nr:ATP-binding cassette domain-containing protein [Clostridia bacterium]
MLKALNLNKAYDKAVISDFSFAFPEKGLFLIRGSSGSGKTTLIKLLANLEKADSGKVETNKEDKISFVFQEPRLVPHLNLLENVLLVKKEKDTAKAREILKALGLEKDEKKHPNELSGGMKLRTSIARSLYFGGNIYLWDEPTKELDPENAKNIIEIIKNLSEKHLVIVVTHDQNLESENIIEL